jgi:hypothetical protein
MVWRGPSGPISSPQCPELKSGNSSAFAWQQIETLFAGDYLREDEKKKKDPEGLKEETTAFPTHFQPCWIQH